MENKYVPPRFVHCQAVVITEVRVRRDKTSDGKAGPNAIQCRIKTDKGDVTFKPSLAVVQEGKMMGVKVETLTSDKMSLEDFFRKYPFVERIAALVEKKPAKAVISYKILPPAQNGVEYQIFGEKQFCNMAVSGLDTEKANLAYLQAQQEKWAGDKVEAKEEPEEGEDIE